MSITGERLKVQRKRLGMNADDVADRLNVSRSTIFRYESGQIEKVPSNILERLAGILETSVEYLMGWTDNYTRNGKKAPEGLGGIYYSIAKDAEDSDIDPEDFKLALEMAKKFRGKK